MMERLSENKEKALIFKALCHILYNQEQLMRHYGEENFYLVEDTNTLSIEFSKLAESYNKLDDN